MSTNRPSKVRVTQTLLTSWEYSFKTDDGYESFLKTLNREKTPPTKAMLDGIRYENCLNSVLLGEHLPPDHEWLFPITEMAEELQGSQQQVTLFKEIQVDGQTTLLHGVLDYLRAGEIWDCKFSKTYHLNKYLNCPQLMMYLSLVPEARRMTFIVSDGKYVYRERYPRDIVEPIDLTIKYFYEYLKRYDLWKTFIEKWSVN